MMDVLLSKRLLAHTRVHRQNPPTSQLGRSVLPRVNQIPNLFFTEIIHWRVKGSCSLVQLEGVRISAAFGADSGGQEFLEDCALGRTSEKIRPGVTQRVGDDPLGRRFLRASRADVGVEIEPGYPPKADGQILEEPLGDEA